MVGGILPVRLRRHRCYGLLKYGGILININIGYTLIFLFLVKRELMRVVLIDKLYHLYLHVVGFINFNILCMTDGSLEGVIV